MQRGYKPRGTGNSSNHSIRADRTTWERAKVRARSEGLTLNHVLNTFIEAYGDGKLNMPRVTARFEDSGT